MLIFVSILFLLAMAGLYIHIPFCSKRCLYCDFYSNTDMSLKNSYISALQKELQERKDYLNKEPIQTIYFGGGTPSQLTAKDFEIIFNTIASSYDISNCKEITVEANPDDLTPTYIKDLKQLPFNRLSIGIQSFNDDDLTFLNRRHTASQAIETIQLCQDKGYTNISIDLIYGLPKQTLEKWNLNLDKAFQLNVTHFSAYHLIYEEGTKLYNLWKRGEVAPVKEETSLLLFKSLIERARSEDYIHYEISNFAKEGYYSMHNSSYWNRTKYLGIGPSAHSYNGETRQWNTPSIKDYLTKRTFEIEPLPIETKYNEFILTGLRTIWGISIATIEQEFATQIPSLMNHIKKWISYYVTKGMLLQEGDKIKLTPEGVFISDSIIRDFMYIK